MKGERDTAIRLAQDTQGIMHQIQDNETRKGNPRGSRQYQKLKAELERTLNDFQASSADSLAKEREFVNRSRSNSFSDVGAAGGGGAGLAAWGYQAASEWRGNGRDGQKAGLLENDHLGQQRRQEQEQLGNEMDFNEGIIEERADGLREIEGQMAQVNEIFKDLALLVHEQGETIDTIAEQTDRTMSTTEKANAQLFKAKKYQKSYRQKMCCVTIMMLMIVLALCIFLNVLGGGSHNNNLLSSRGPLTPTNAFLRPAVDSA